MANVTDIVSLAKWAIARTRSIIPYSSNLTDLQLAHRLLYLNLLRSNPVGQDKEFIQELREWHLDLSSESERYPLVGSEIWIESLNKYESFKSLIARIKKIPELKDKKLTSFEFIETLATRALRYGIGNCGETSAYALLLLMEYPTEGIPGYPEINEPISVERFAFTENDHAFLILNRDPKTPINSPKDWNDDTVICDPWSQEVYTKAEIFNNNNNENYFTTYIKHKFQKVELTPHNQRCFIGEKFNDEIHSDRWLRKANQSNKFWRPIRLIDVIERPKLTEKLPSYRPQKKNLKLKTTANPLSALGNEDKMLFDIFESNTANGKPVKSCKNITAIYSHAEIQDFFNELEQLFISTLQTSKKPFILNFKNMNEDIRVVWLNGEWRVYDDASGRILLKSKAEIVDDLFRAFSDNFQSDKVWWNIEFSRIRNDLGRLKYLLRNFNYVVKDNLQEKDVNSQNNDGLTLLHFAVMAEDLLLAKRLLEEGAKALIKDKDKNTPLLLAILNGNTKMLQLFLQKYPELGEEAFTIAIDYNFSRVVEFLLQKGIVPNQEQVLSVLLSNNELTRLFMASNSHNIKIILPWQTVLKIFKERGLENIFHILFDNKGLITDNLEITPSFLISENFINLLKTVDVLQRARFELNEFVRNKPKMKQTQIDLLSENISTTSHILNNNEFVLNGISIELSSFLQLQFDQLINVTDLFPTNIQLLKNLLENYINHARTAGEIDYFHCIGKFTPNEFSFTSIYKGKLTSFLDAIWKMTTSGWDLNVLQSYFWLATLVEMPFEEQCYRLKNLLLANHQSSNLTPANLHQFDFLFKMPSIQQPFVTNETIFLNLLESINLHELAFKQNQFNIENLFIFLKQIEQLMPAKYSERQLELIEDYFKEKQASQQFSLREACILFDKYFATKREDQLQESTSNYSPVLFSLHLAKTKTNKNDLQEFFQFLLEYINNIRSMSTDSQYRKILNKMEDIVLVSQKAIPNDAAINNLSSGEIYHIKKECQSEMLEILQENESEDLLNIKYEIENLKLDPPSELRI